jgi:hypothetical protein
MRWRFANARPLYSQGRSQSVVRLFEAFCTTKPGGLGMGPGDLPFDHPGSRGRLWATANELQLTPPLEREQTVPAEHAGPMPAARQST